MDDDIIVTLKRSNDLLMTFGNDYSDVFLPAIYEIEQLRKVLKDVLETSEEQIPYGTVKAIRSALKEKE